MIYSLLCLAVMCLASMQGMTFDWMEGPDEPSMVYSGRLRDCVAIDERDGTVYYYINTKKFKIDPVSNQVMLIRDDLPRIYWCYPDKSIYRSDGMLLQLWEYDVNSNVLCYTDVRDDSRTCSSEAGRRIDDPNLVYDSHFSDDYIFVLAKNLRLQMYSISMDMWYIIPYLNDERRDAMVTLDPVNGYLYIFGGRKEIAPNTYRELDDIWRLDLNDMDCLKNTPWKCGWEKLAQTLPRSRRGGIALYSCLEECIFIVGGLHGPESQSSIFKCDTSMDPLRCEIMDESNDMVYTRYYHGGALSKCTNKMYVFGGTGHKDGNDQLQRSEETWEVTESPVIFCEKRECRKAGRMSQCIAKMDNAVTINADGSCRNNFASDCGYLTTCNQCGSAGKCVRKCNREVRLSGAMGVDCQANCAAQNDPYLCWIPDCSM